ncbi:notchless-like protein [Reticulomyxa filosa]|uniref:Notchless-like protein n=1 Tax=Reticulomyxa filosa TaxID=46433 RepID=X6LDX1_RETFI|nr:notchless-like protein [Reticulomyxa filosa]|eukprot:ETN99753.1 notchless-like protein [Reticulomyxa filosa]
MIVNSFILDQMIKQCVYGMLITNKQIQSFNEHSNPVYCAKFSSYHYHYHRQNVIYSSSYDKTIRLWDSETSKLLHIFNGHTDCFWCIDISPLQVNNNNNKMNNIGVIGGNGYTICSEYYSNMGY